MPSVDVRMMRSLRGGVFGSIAQSLGTTLAPRDAIGDIQNSVTDAKQAFSSWDNCMQAAYCKWPAIALMIVAGLIIFSVVWCIIRCACCGVSCCCECCYCLKCCGNCCGCCDPPRGRPSKYLDEPYIPPHQGYRAEEPMKVPPRNFSPTFSSAASPSVHQPPQYAEFETSKKSAGGEDALPAMPSWEGASSKKVMLEEEGVEMNNLAKPEASMAGAGAGAGAVAGVGAGAGAGAAAAASTLSGPSSGIHGGRLSPNSQGPYGAQSPYASTEQGYGGYNGAGYRQPSTSPGPDVAYAAAGAIGMATGRNSPHRGDYNGYANNQSAQGYQRANSPQAYGGYGQPHSPYDGGYGSGPRSESPAHAYNNGQSRLSPVPQAGAGYGGYEQNQYSQAGGYGQQGYSAQQQHPYPAELAHRQDSYPQELPAQPVEMPSAQGFNFNNNGYSRPQENDYNHNRQPSPKIAQPVPQGSNAFPGGYRSYQSTNQSQNSWN